MTTAFRMPTEAEIADHVSDLSKFSRWKYCAGAPVVNECPFCGAAPGWECKSSTGNQPPMHKARVRLVADWDVDRRIRAYAKLKLVALWQQGEARARMDELNADPVKVAARNEGWARQRAAMARIDDEICEAGKHCNEVAFHAPGCRCAEGGAPVRPLHQREPDVAPVVELEGFRLKRATRPQGSKPLSPFRGNGGVA